MNWNEKQREFGDRRKQIKTKYQNQKNIVLMEMRSKMLEIDIKEREDLMKVTHEESILLEQYQNEKKNKSVASI